MTKDKVEEICNHYCGNDMAILRRIVSKMMTQFGGLCDAQYDDYLSVANETVYHAACSFNETENNNFDYYLKSCIERKLKTVFRDSLRDKRSKTYVKDKDGNTYKVEMSSISFDTVITEDGEGTFAEICDFGNSLENEYFSEHYSDEVNEYLNKLTQKQRMMAKMFEDGVPVAKVKEVLKLSETRYKMLIDDMTSFYKCTMLTSKNRVSF